MVGGSIRLYDGGERAGGGLLGPHDDEADLAAAQAVRRAEVWVEEPDVLLMKWVETGLLLRNLTYITIVQKPYYLLDISTMVS